MFFADDDDEKKYLHLYKQNQTKSNKIKQNQTN